MRIGIDVGGTNTDAVLLEGEGTGVSVLAANKSATSADVTAGIVDDPGPVAGRAVLRPRRRSRR